MSSVESKIQDFTDLKAWQEAQAFSVKVYKATKNFTDEEVYSLTSQLRRSAVSVSSNIAGGFGRKSDADKVHFYNMAHTSVDELRSQVYAARDLNYMSNEAAAAILDQALTTLRIIIGLIRSIKDD